MIAEPNSCTSIYHMLMNIFHASVITTRMGNQHPWLIAHWTMTSNEHSTVVVDCTLDADKCSCCRCKTTRQVGVTRTTISHVTLQEQCMAREKAMAMHQSFGVIYLYQVRDTQIQYMYYFIRCGV